MASLAAPSACRVKVRISTRARATTYDSGWVRTKDSDYGLILAPSKGRGSPNPDPDPNPNLGLGEGWGSKMEFMKTECIEENLRETNDG